MAKIKATIRGHSANVEARRPSWQDMKKNYLGDEVESIDFYPKISKSYLNFYELNHRDFENTCASRMSYALNRSGILLPRKPQGVVKGDDGFYYWIRVAELRDKLIRLFGKGDFEYKFKTKITIDDLQNDLTKKKFMERVEESKINMLKKISGKHGIVVFKVSGWGDASGHFTLWDGKTLSFVGNPEHNDINSNLYYFWLTEIRSSVRIVQVDKIIFWELK